MTRRPEAAVTAPRRIVPALLAALLTLGALLAAGPASNATARPSFAHPGAAAPRSAEFHRACAPAHGLRATCFARYRSVPAAKLPKGPKLTPKDIASAYELPAKQQGHGTVAIVDAFDNPKAERDLAAYRKHFGLPPCTTANGCFRKVNGNGKAAPLPTKDPDWGVEISLDLDAVSASCPACHILLVEGRTPSIRALGTAVNTAVALGAKVVSNSYGLPEFNGMQRFARAYYWHRRVPIVVSTGDESFGVPNFPAVLARSVAVGGTTLRRAPTTTRGWTEHAWFGASSGCSGYIAKPAWQTDSHCPTRMVADVSAVADLNSGFLVYDSFGLGKQNGFIQVGGTSLSAPLIAGMVVRAGHETSLHTAQYIYQHATALHDVRGGSNGYCGGDYLCRGKAGYDGPTGLGSPRGLAAL
jgi:subtilase family serine protease